MTDKQFDQLSEQEFDLYLEEIIDNPPPADLSNEFKPWRKAMNRILWGTALTTLTLNFWNLDVIMPAIGIILSESMSYLSAGMWWLAVLPGVSLVAVVMLFDLAGSSLRRLVDPHSAQE